MKSFLYPIIVSAVCIAATIPLTAQLIHWGYPITGAGSSSIKDLEVINGNQLLASGYLSHNSDIDLLDGVEMVTADYTNIPFIGIYNTDGELLNSLAVNAHGSVEMTAMLANGDFIAGGQVAGVANWGGNPMSIPANHGQDVFICRYNSDLELVWQWSMGGNSIDSLYDVIAGDDGRIYFCGQFRGQMTVSMQGQMVEYSTSDFQESGDLTTPDGFVACMDSDGNLLWLNTVGSVGYNSVSRVNQHEDIVVYGGFAWAGSLRINDSTLYDSPWSNSFFVICANTDGETNWARHSITVDLDAFVGGVGFTDNLIHVFGRFAVSLEFDESDNVEGVGSVNSHDAFYARFEYDGTVVSQNRMGGQYRDEFNAVKILGDNEIISCFTHHGGDFGINQSFLLGGGLNDTATSSAMFVYDLAGEVVSTIFIYAYNDNYNAKINAVARIEDDYYLAVDLVGTALFNYDEYLELTSGGAQDAVLAKYGVCLMPIMPEILISDTEICRGDSIEVTLVGGQLNGCDDWGWTYNYEPPHPFNGDTTVFISPNYYGWVDIYGIGGCVHQSQRKWSSVYNVLDSPNGEVNVYNWEDEPCGFDVHFSPNSTATYDYIWEPPVSDNNIANDLCQGTYTLTVTLPNGCYFSETIILQTVDIDDVTSTDLPFEYYLSLYQGTFNLNLHSSSTELFVFDQKGSLVRSSRLIQGPNSLAIADLAAGVYVAVIQDDKNRYALKWMWPGKL
jgi:hypothetical protein